jgi:hypothetical protein
VCLITQPMGLIHVAGHWASSARAYRSAAEPCVYIYHTPWGPLGGTGGVFRSVVLESHVFSRRSLLEVVCRHLPPVKRT